MGTERNDARRKQFRARIAKSRPNCHICGQEIDWEAGHLDPRSFVIDHVVPLARGGRDDMSNVRAAHRECNSLKRARNYAPIVRRSGSLNR